MRYKRVIARLSGLVAVLVSVVLLGTAAPAGAIINGTFDGNRHPNAGAMQALFPDGSFEICSGVLISPTYFATAAHCVKGPLDNGAKAADFLVTFDSDFTPVTVRVYHVLDVHYDPGLAGDSSTDTVEPNGHDLGVLHLAEAVQGITPAALPALHSLDSLAHNGAHPTLESVGYGTEGFNGNKPFLTGQRNYADTYLASSKPAISDLFLRVNSQRGGLCYGDSGGPTFLGTSTSPVLSLTSGFHSAHCASWAFTTRLDTQIAHDFYAPYH
jgi:secreted trypsin-like serine protease